jgi:starvation-inducible DNA-binding protein
LNGGFCQKPPFNVARHNARAKSVATLNQVLADKITIRDMYKKHYWQMSGSTLHQLHLLLDAHYEAQVVLVHMLDERIGGISIAMAADVAEMTMIPCPPKGREDVPTQLSRLLEAHEIILRQAHEGVD